MSRLPTALEPLVPAVTRAQRVATRTVRAASRLRPTRGGADRRPPTQGTPTARDTARMEPAAVTRHAVSSPETLVRALPRGRPGGHPFWRDLDRAQVPGRFVLEIRDGRVVGGYAAHITPGGLLDFETSDYWGARSWREHPVFLGWRTPEVQHHDGTVVSLATRGTAGNYYHFVMDLLPRWGVLREAFPDLAPDRVILNSRAGYQQEYLDLLHHQDAGLAATQVIEQTPRLAVRAERLLVPSLPNPDALAPRWTTDWLRRTFPARLRSVGAGERPRRIYLTRGGRRNTRRVANESVLLPILATYGFEVVDTGELGVQEQIDLFAAAEAVVAPHGAALTNLVFAPPGVRVLELFAPRFLNSCFWAIACNIPHSRYRYLVGLSDRRTDPAGAMRGVQDDIVVDLHAFEVSLVTLLRR